MKLGVVSPTVLLLPFGTDTKLCPLVLIRNPPTDAPGAHRQPVRCFVSPTPPAEVGQNPNVRLS